MVNVVAVSREMGVQASKSEEKNVWIALWEAKTLVAWHGLTA